jgi:hypothetical protein
MSLEHSPARQKRNARQKRKKKKPPLPLADIKLLERLTVPQFCLLYNVKRARLYEMWKTGGGPDYCHDRSDGRLVFITAEAAKRWSREREQATQRELAERKSTMPEKQKATEAAA